MPLTLFPTHLASLAGRDQGSRVFKMGCQGQKLGSERKLAKNLQVQARMKRDLQRRRHSTHPADMLPVGSLVLMEMQSTIMLNKGLEGPYQIIARATRSGSTDHLYCI